jgi:hypothetical protein
VCVFIMCVCLLLQDLVHIVLRQQPHFQASRVPRWKPSLRKIFFNFISFICIRSAAKPRIISDDKTELNFFSPIGISSFQNFCVSPSIYEGFNFFREYCTLGETVLTNINKLHCFILNLDVVRSYARPCDTALMQYLYKHKSVRVLCSHVTKKKTENFV